MLVDPPLATDQGGGHVIGRDSRPAGREAVEDVARALWAQAQGRSLAKELAEAGIPMLVLKGPELQSRLYGTPAAYLSGDVDVLVPPGHAKRARQVLERAGWTFDADNGVLWRTSAAAAYVRDGLYVDLHWGIHAAHLPATALRPLEAALWEGARPGPGGMLEPDPESLLVFLSVHVVGHRFERSEWQENVVACSRLVKDWSKVRRIARDARVEASVRVALAGGLPGETFPVMDGMRGRIISTAAWLVRGHFLPREVRDAIREGLTLRRHGFGLLGWTRVRTVPYAGRGFLVPLGVFPPQKASTLVSLGLEAIADAPAPVVVEVGTGSGAVALSIGSRRQDATVFATDISHRALTSAWVNRRRLGLRNVRFYRGNLLEPVPPSIRGRTTLIVANMPFVPARYSWDFAHVAPMSAIEGQGADGLTLLRDLARQAAGFLEPGGVLICQMYEWQWPLLAESLLALGYRLHALRSGIPAFGVAEWKGGTVE